jgi:hypothetical protein
LAGAGLIGEGFEEEVESWALRDEVIRFIVREAEAADSFGEEAGDAVAAVDGGFK